MSVVHSVPPFGPRHITQLTGSWELLRPNLKDVMYQFEADTFKDGMLGTKDHAGAGLMLARWARGGRPSAVCGSRRFACSAMHACVDV